MRTRIKNRVRAVLRSSDPKKDEEKRWPKAEQAAHSTVDDPAGIGVSAEASAEASAAAGAEESDEARVGDVAQLLAAVQAQSAELLRTLAMPEKPVLKLSASKVQLEVVSASSAEASVDEYAARVTQTPAFQSGSLALAHHHSSMLEERQAQAAVRLQTRVRGNAARDDLDLN